MSLENAKFKELDKYVVKKWISYENFYVWVTNNVYEINKDINDFIHVEFIISETASYVEKHFIAKWCKSISNWKNNNGNIVYLYTINE